jgi:hypothetical protein
MEEILIIILVVLLWAVDHHYTYKRAYRKGVLRGKQSFGESTMTKSGIILRDTIWPKSRQ